VSSVLWQSTREQVIAVFPKPPGLPKDIDAYLASIDEAYRIDAYHSLSIEGYRVTVELIDRVRSGDWNPDGQGSDKADRNALAARGYWQAFRRVRSVVRDIVKGEAPGPLVAEHHRDWYRELFQPSVAAGLIEPPALAGCRIEAIYLRGSRHVPPRSEVLPDAMSAFFELLHNENEACVRFLVTGCSATSTHTPTVTGESLVL